MAPRAVIAFMMVLAFIGYVVFQVLFRKKSGAEYNNEIMFIAFFAAVWIIICLLLW
jgi:hypothetical protein